MKFNYLIERIERNSDGSVIHNFYGMGRRIGLKYYGITLKRIYLENFVYDGLLVAIDSDGSLTSRIQKTDPVDDLKFLHQKIIQVNIFGSTETAVDLKRKIWPELVNIQNVKLSNAMTCAISSGFDSIKYGVKALISEASYGNENESNAGVTPGSGEKPEPDLNEKSTGSEIENISKLRNFVNKLRGKTFDF